MASCVGLGRGVWFSFLLVFLEWVDMFNIDMWAEYTVWGVLGAAAHLLVMKFAWKERTYPVRELGLAIILAFVISQLGLPNRFTTFGIAFLGVDAIEAFLRRLVGQVKEDGG